MLAWQLLGCACAVSEFEQNPTYLRPKFGIIYELLTINLGGFLSLI